MNLIKILIKKCLVQSDFQKNISHLCFSKKKLSKIRVLINYKIFWLLNEKINDLFSSLLIFITYL